MKSFREMGIKVSSPNFIGEKVNVDRIINCEIKILAYKIGPSNQKPGTDCLTMQIEWDGQMRVLFSGAKGLMEAIKQVNAGDFPFKTTIQRTDRKLEFT